MKALDLFCCAGGATAGLEMAGYTVTGVDIKPQPNWPGCGGFIQGSALEVARDASYLREFDFIWASPPCQFATAYKRRPNHVAEVANLIPQTRELLAGCGVPFVIENIYGARTELRNPVTLCGSMFKLDVRRHRCFETSGFTLDQQLCEHERQTPRFPPATNRKNLRSTVEVGVWRIPLEVQQKAMGGCEWMTLKELSQAIPPVYAQHIALEVINPRAY